MARTSPMIVLPVLVQIGLGDRERNCIDRGA